MWKRAAAAGFAAALLVAAVVLLRRVSEPNAEASTSVVAKVAESRTSTLPAASGIRASTADPVGSIGSDGAPAPEIQGPSAGVWKVLDQGHSTPQQQRDALITAFRAAPPCTAHWCDEGRATLASWQTAIAAKVPDAMTADAIECSAAGCWMKIAVTDAGKWREVSAALPAVTAEKAWPGPSIQGGPDFQTQRGAVISMWAILPNVASKPSLDNKGAE